MRDEDSSHPVQPFQRRPALRAVGYYVGLADDQRTSKPGAAGLASPRSSCLPCPRQPQRSPTIERRPPKLDLTIYPYLPRVAVATTSASSYLALLGRAA